MEVLLYCGITGLIEKLSIFSGLIIYEHINNIDGIMNDFYTYFTKTSIIIIIIIFIQFLYQIAIYAIFYLLLMLVLYYLRPNHLIFSDEMTVFF